MKNEKKIYVCQELRMKAIGVKSDNGDGHYITYELIIKYVFFFHLTSVFFAEHSSNPLNILSNIEQFLLVTHLINNVKKYFGIFYWAIYTEGKV